MWSIIETHEDESDTRLWLNLKHSTGRKMFILSSDTDIYHICLLLIYAGDSVVIQLSRPSDKDLKSKYMNIFIDLLKRDTYLVHIHDSHIPRVLQTQFVCTSCDYIFYFSGIGWWVVLIL